MSNQALVELDALCNSLNKKSRPSVLAKLEQFKTLIQSAVVDRTKKKELER